MTLNRKGNKRGTNQGFIDNQFKPGQVTNPEGRPPNAKYLSEWARELLQAVPKGELEGKAADELITMALLREALKGNTKAIEMLHDWTEGKIPDRHQIESASITLIRQSSPDKAP